MVWRVATQNYCLFVLPCKNPILKDAFNGNAGRPTVGTRLRLTLLVGTFGESQVD